MQSIRMGVSAFGTAVAALLCASPSAAQGTRLETLRFVDSNPAPSPVVGFRLYVAYDGGAYAPIDVGMPAAGTDGVRSFPLLVASDAAVQAMLTAYDAYGGESGASNRILRTRRRPAFDHDGDGASDVVRIDDASGLVEILSGGSAANAKALPQAAPPGALLVARSDFDGSGTSDLLWQRRGHRDLTLWLLGTAGGTSLSGDVSVTVNNLAHLGPVAAWSFDEGTGKVAGDVSGNGNQGALVGTTWTTQGRFGRALGFTGSARVVVPDSASLDLTTGMTLEAWVYPTQATAKWSAILQKEADAYLLHASTPGSGVPVVGATLGGSCCTLVYAPSPLPVNTWTHLAATYDGAQLVSYVNGVAVASDSATGAIQTTDTPLRIGNSSYAGDAFAGRIDEVRIYDRALGAGELQADMNASVTSSAVAAPTSPLTVSLASPPVGPVSGVVTLQAPAAGTAPAGGVQFLLDGTPLGPVDTQAPYEVAWDTRGVSDGVHTLSARAAGAAGSVDAVVLPTPTPGLRLLGSGDLDGDARGDLVFQDVATGDLDLWLMNGATVRQEAVIPGPATPWRLVGIGDVDADRRSDLVWWDPSTGELRIWHMNGAAVLEDLRPTELLPPGAKPIGLGDYDGDGTSDLFARLGFPIWIGVASLRDGVSPISVVAAVDGTRVDVATGHDFDGDGTADLLLVTPSTRTASVLLLGASGGSSAPLDFSAASLPEDVARQIGDRDADWNPDSCDVDFNNDGTVGNPDLLLFGYCVADPAADGCEWVDANGDGELGLPEFLLIGSEFGGAVCEALPSP